VLRVDLIAPALRVCPFFRTNRQKKGFVNLLARRNAHHLRLQGIRIAAPSETTSLSAMPDEPRAARFRAPCAESSMTTAKSFLCGESLALRLAVPALEAFARKKNRSRSFVGASLPVTVGPASICVCAENSWAARQSSTQKQANRFAGGTPRGYQNHSFVESRQALRVP